MSYSNSISIRVFLLPVQRDSTEQSTSQHILRREGPGQAAEVAPAGVSSQPREACLEDSPSDLQVEIAELHLMPAFHSLALVRSSRRELDAV